MLFRVNIVTEKRTSFLKVLLGLCRLTETDSECQIPPSKDDMLNDGGSCGGASSCFARRRRLHAGADTGESHMSKSAAESGVSSAGCWADGLVCPWNFPETGPNRRLMNERRPGAETVCVAGRYHSGDASFEEAR